MESLDSKEKNGRGAVGAAMNYLRFSIASENKPPQVTDVHFSRWTYTQSHTQNCAHERPSLPPCHPFNPKLGVLSAAALVYVPS